VAVSELVLSGFLRVVTHPKIFRDPSPLAVAMEFVEDLRTIGHCVSDRAVASLLKKGGFSLQAMRKTKEGGTHEHRDARFSNIAVNIAAKVNAYQAGAQPVVSIDAKKNELVGTFASKGREWQPKGQPEEANVYDFIDKTLGKVTPYGIYDVVSNEAWVSVGIDHDTAEFAVESLRRWWRETGCALYPKAGSCWSRRMGVAATAAVSASGNFRCSASRRKADLRPGFATIRRERASGTRSNTACSTISA